MSGDWREDTVTARSKDLFEHVIKLCNLPPEQRYQKIVLTLEAGGPATVESKVVVSKPRN